MEDEKYLEPDVLVGKTIAEIEVNGFEIHIKTTDGVVFDYSASDGGYSCWSVYK